MTIYYRSFETKQKNKYTKHVIDFYNRYFSQKSNIKIVKNSSVFWIAIKNKEIVGVTRLLTDYSRNAFLLDLIVKKSERNQKIGRHLVNQVSEYCNKKKIEHLYLFTDPRYTWLIEFYKKLGFKLTTNQFLMEFHKNTNK